MKIENGYLIVTMQGVEKTVPLPALAVPANVKAWVVQSEYRENNLFVAVTPLGGIEEVPACNLADCSYLGELPLDPDLSLQLEAEKAIKRDEINTACDTAVAAIAAGYPDREVQSWPQQVKEAEMVVSYPSAELPEGVHAPLLEAIATARNVPLAELAQRVVSKSSAYASVSGALIGRRQAAEDRINAAESPEAIAEIVF